MIFIDDLGSRIIAEWTNTRGEFSQACLGPTCSASNRLYPSNRLKHHVSYIAPMSRINGADALCNNLLLLT